MEPHFSSTVETLEELWLGPLTRAREGRFTLEDDRTIRNVLESLDVGRSDVIPKKLVTQLWFIPQFMEWQTDRVSYNVDNYNGYAILCSWVGARIGELLGEP